MKHVQDTNSYMQLCLYQEGRGNLYLMVPTYWDAVHNHWMGFVKTPKTGKLIHSVGKDSKELENNFNIALHKGFEEMPEEIFGMFHPLEHWEQKLRND